MVAKRIVYSFSKQRIGPDSDVDHMLPTFKKQMQNWKTIESSHYYSESGYSTKINSFDTTLIITVRLLSEWMHFGFLFQNWNLAVYFSFNDKNNAIPP